MGYFIPGLICFVTSLGVTWLLMRVFTRLGIVDVPGGRKAHARTVPTAGGVAIVAAILVALVFAKTPHLNSILYFAGALIILAVISFFDDIKNLSPFVRVCVHILSVFLLFKSLNYDLDTKTYLFFFVSTIAFINFYNFMDGLDGLAASSAIHIGISVLVLSFFIPIEQDKTYIALALACSALGFLVFNWAPAKIFMGDVGSITLGAISAWLLLDLVFSGHFWTAAIIPAYLMSDAGVTMLSRLFRGENIWKPHLQNFYQKYFRKSGSHKKVVLRVICINFILLLLSVMSVYFEKTSALLATLLIFFTLARFSKAKKISDA